MTNRIYQIGDYVEKFCSACHEQHGHVVKSITKTGTVSRVFCSKCGRSGALRAKEIPTKGISLATKTGAPYDCRQTYRLGQIMTHPAFGTGEVLKVLNTKMIDVLFTDHVRRLIHAR